MTNCSRNILRFMQQYYPLKKANAVSPDTVKTAKGIAMLKYDAASLAAVLTFVLMGILDINYIVNLWLAGLDLPTHVKCLSIIIACMGIVLAICLVALIILQCYVHRYRKRHAAAITAYNDIIDTNTRIIEWAYPWRLTVTISNNTDTPPVTDDAPTTTYQVFATNAQLKVTPACKLTSGKHLVITDGANVIKQLAISKHAQVTIERHRTDAQALLGNQLFEK